MRRCSSDGRRATSRCKKTMNKGTVAYLPLGECPLGFGEGLSRWMKTGIPRAEYDKTTYLRRIPAALRQIMDEPLTCEIEDKPLTTELTVMKSAGGQYVMQLVNFNIPLTRHGSKWWRDPQKAQQSGLNQGFLTLLEEGTWGGKPWPKLEDLGLRGEWDAEIHPEKNLQVKLRVADDFQVSKVRLLSPDMAEEVALDYEIIEPAGGRLVSFTVPQLDIYAVAVVE